MTTFKSIPLSDIKTVSTKTALELLLQHYVINLNRTLTLTLDILRTKLDEKNVRRTCYNRNIVSTCTYKLRTDSTVYANVITSKNFRQSTSEMCPGSTNPSIAFHPAVKRCTEQIERIICITNETTKTIYITNGNNDWGLSSPQLVDGLYVGLVYKFTVQVYTKSQGCCNVIVPTYHSLARFKAKPDRSVYITTPCFLIAS